MSLPKKAEPSSARMAWVDESMSRNTMWAWPRILGVLRATMSRMTPYVANSMYRVRLRSSLGSWSGRLRT
jgi:hypothetical protein